MISKRSVKSFMTEATFDELFGYAAVSERGDFISDIWDTPEGASEQIKEITGRSWEDLTEYGIYIRAVLGKDIQ